MLSIGAGAALIAVVNYHVLLIVMAVVTAAAVAYLLGEPDSGASAAADGIPERITPPAPAPQPGAG